MATTRICITTIVFLTLLLRYIAATDDEENATRIQGCFDFRRLSCNVSMTMGDETIDINTACLAMEQTIREYWGRPVELVHTDKDVERHQISLSHLTMDDDLCYGVQQAYHKCWWCAPAHLSEVPNDFCKFKSCQKPAVITTNITATCLEMEETYEDWQRLGYGYPATIDFCLRAEEASFACPLFCDQPYLGADTDSKKMALIWIARSSSFLTVFGAGYILYDVGSNPKNRKTVYHQLLFAMAAFDVVTGLAWALSTTPVPKDQFWIYGAVGNMATCKIQAFLVQLGFTSIFYNVSLALYYLLVIVYAWREHGLLKIRPYLHGFPLGVGILLAFGGIPIYDWFEYGCHLLPPPDGKRWPIYVFAVGPLGFAILAIMGCMGTVYYKVRSQAQSSKKWSMGGGKASALQEQVFYQCLWYVLSFLVSWPILFANYLASVDVGGPYGLTATIAFVAPLQGFTNFLVYIRPKFNNWKKQRDKKKLKGKTSSTSGGGTTTTSTVGRMSSEVNSSRMHSFRRQFSARRWTVTRPFSFTKRPSGGISAMGANSSQDGVGVSVADSSLAGDSNHTRYDSLAVNSNHSRFDSLAVNSNHSRFDSLAVGSNHSRVESEAQPTDEVGGKNDNKDDDHDEMEDLDPSVLIAKEGYFEKELEKEQRQQQEAEEQKQEEGKHEEQEMTPTAAQLHQIVEEETERDLEKT